MDTDSSPNKAERVKTGVKTKLSAYALRLPASIKAEAEKLAAEDGTSLNQFVASAVAEKVAALRTASYFLQFKARADFAAFDRIMHRAGGDPAQGSDVIPAGLKLHDK